MLITSLNFLSDTVTVRKIRGPSVGLGRGHRSKHLFHLPQWHSCQNKRLSHSDFHLLDHGLGRNTVGEVIHVINIVGK